MNTQEKANHLVNHSHNDRRFIGVAIIVFSSLTLGLLPIVNFLNLSAPENVVPHQAELWGAMGDKQ
ncbi:MAG: hypothetical protein WBA13_19810 [Microcoleaceae cyanobacterium]